MHFVIWVLIPCVLLGSVAAAEDNKPAGGGFDEWKARRRGKALAGSDSPTTAASDAPKPAASDASNAAASDAPNTAAMLEAKVNNDDAKKEEKEKEEKNKVGMTDEDKKGGKGKKKKENKKHEHKAAEKKGSKGKRESKHGKKEGKHGKKEGKHGKKEGKGKKEESKKGINKEVPPASNKEAPPASKAVARKAVFLHPNKIKATEAFQKFIKDIPYFEGLKGSKLRALSIRYSKELDKLVLVASIYEPFTSKLFQLDKGKFVSCDAECVKAMKKISEKIEVKKLSDPLATSITSDAGTSQEATNSTSDKGDEKFKDFVKDTPFKKFGEQKLRILSMRYSPALNTLILAIATTGSSGHRIHWLNKEGEFEECAKGECVDVMKNQVKLFAMKRLNRRLKKKAEKAQPAGKAQNKVPEPDAKKSK